MKLQSLDLILLIDGYRKSLTNSLADLLSLAPIWSPAISATEMKVSKRPSEGLGLVKFLVDLSH